MKLRHLFFACSGVFVMMFSLLLFGGDCLLG